MASDIMIIILFSFLFTWKSIMEGFVVFLFKFVWFMAAKVLPIGIFKI